MQKSRGVRFWRQIARGGIDAGLFPLFPLTFIQIINSGNSGRAGGARVLKKCSHRSHCSPALSERLPSPCPLTPPGGIFLSP